MTFEYENYGTLFGHPFENHVKWRNKVEWQLAHKRDTKEQFPHAMI